MSSALDFWLRTVPPQYVGYFLPIKSLFQLPQNIRLFTLGFAELLQKQILWTLSSCSLAVPVPTVVFLFYWMSYHSFSRMWLSFLRSRNTPLSSEHCRVYTFKISETKQNFSLCNFGILLDRWTRCSSVRGSS